ncbi:hypothetical protein FFLO_00991 [Filobasidium floriforme]|uniref:IMS import disulfide relay-system CHCH-CHCH-like Cx9C domain-containing protein n=1 Tax=Filobasidium floriforme TaxID=5210 RepID=A0A8K0JQC7_9TREE|nr:hypothetical protein FFLO_00991 [Filobasidium floriforme]
MDIAYNLVASKCAQQMQAYQECVMKNQDGNWADICRDQSQAVTQCANETIPNLSSLKTTCQSQIETYTRCVDSASRTGLSDKEMEESCRDSMKDLWKCCEGVLGGVAGGSS